MRNPGMLTAKRLTGFGIVLLLGLVSSGCTSSSPAARPGFVMPAPGDATATVLRIGDTFPVLEGHDLEGNSVTLDAGMRGERYTLVVFWSTWCGFCMLELLHEIELSRQYDPLGLRVIGINADETAEDARRAVQKYDIPWPILFEGPDREISDQLGIKQWPELLLLDSQGKVVMTAAELRAISVETLDDGTDHQISGLEWALRTLLGEKPRRRKSTAP
jgi:thiol-disulfide isomerase/thioredoxin